MGDVHKLSDETTHFDTIDIGHESPTPNPLPISSSIVSHRQILGMLCSAHTHVPFLLVGPKHGPNPNLSSLWHKGCHDHACMMGDSLGIILWDTWIL